MNLSELTDQQRAIVESDLRRFVVAASAGSGKTTVLRERYLRHVVQDGIRPDQILTITFTRKAAYEMKRRIVDGLRDAGRTEDAQIAETGPIQTIHSFCERLLRENALAAGLDPEFEILGDSDAKLIVDRALRAALGADLEHRPTVRALMRAIAGKRGQNSGPYEVLLTSVRDTLDQLRGSGFPRSHFQALYSDANSIRREWEARILESLPDDVRDAMPPGDEPLKERIKAAVKAADRKRNYADWQKGNANPTAEAEAPVHTAGLVALACDAWERIDAEMDARQTLDYTELEQRALRLLERSPEVGARVRRQFRVAMVDESQDNSRFQHRLVEALGIETTIRIGDAQQSIYGWRQADHALFREISGRQETLGLNRNFRSDRGILEFVNDVFRGWWPDAYQPMWNAEMGPPSELRVDLDAEPEPSPTYAGVEFWEMEKMDAGAIARGIRDAIAQGANPSDITVVVRSGRTANRIHAALDTLDIPSRIAGGSARYYARLEVRDLANAAAAVSDPLDDYALLATLRSPLVGLSLDAILLLGSEPGVLRRLPEFESPVVGDAELIQSFLAWFRPLNAIADRLPAWEVIAEILARSPAMPALARRRRHQRLLANVRKLLAIAAADPAMGPVEFAERIREIQQIQHKEGDAPAEEPDADLVTIMTIHKAKGLEFHTVVLPDTDSKLVGQSSRVLVDAETGTVAVNLTGKCLAFEWLDSRRKARNIAEEERVAYVAFTRAKRRLILAMPNARFESVARRLAKFPLPAQSRKPY